MFAIWLVILFCCLILGLGILISFAPLEPIKGTPPPPINCSICHLTKPEFRTSLT